VWWAAMGLLLTLSQVAHADVVPMDSGCPPGAVFDSAGHGSGCRAAPLCETTTCSDREQVCRTVSLCRRVDGGTTGTACETAADCPSWAEFECESADRCTQRRVVANCGSVPAGAATTGVLIMLALAGRARRQRV